MSITAALKTIPLHLDKLDAVFNLGHVLALRKAESDVSFFQKLAKNNALLIALETISFLGNSIFLGVKIEQNWKLLSIAAPFPVIIVWTGMGVTACVIMSSLSVVALVNKIALGTFVPDENENTNDLRLTKATNELFVNFRHSTRIIIQLATLYFAPANPFFIFSTACEIYGLLKMTKRKWVTFDVPGQLAVFSVPKTPAIPAEVLDEKIKSTIIKYQLTANERFTVGMSPLRERPLSFERTVRCQLKDQETWKAILQSVGVIGMLTFSLNPRANSVYLMAPFATILLALGARLVNRHLKFRRQQEFFSLLISYPLQTREQDLEQIRNQVLRDNEWQDPISFGLLKKDVILSPATLIIDRMAFLTESTLLQLFSLPDDYKSFTKSPNFEESILHHPIYRSRLPNDEQERVVQQVCRTFMITKDQFIDCWKLVLERTPQIPLEDIYSWFQSKFEFTDDIMAMIKEVFNSLSPEGIRQIMISTQLQNEETRFEFSNFMLSEQAGYIRLMRFHNFCKLLPKSIRKRLKKHLSPETIKKLHRVKDLA